MFLDSMRAKIKGSAMRVVFPDGAEANALQAAEKLSRDKTLVPVLLGDPAAIEKKAKEHKHDVSNIEIIDPASDKDYEKYVDEYVELRKHKGMTKEEAKKKILLPHYFGAFLTHSERVDGMVSGLTSKTKPFIPAFEIVKLQDGFKRASSLFVLEWPERLLFFADCSVNIEPDAQTLADIAAGTIQTVKSFEIEPRVAFLSFSTRDSAKGPQVDKVKEATKLAKADFPNCIIDGEVQFDTAFLPEIATKKAPDSPFTECGANIFIFPDLNSGNIAYKISERLGKATATGPILQGLRRAVNDVSRGCSAEGFANVATLTAASALMNRALDK